jgi:hypothetical protein
VVQEHYYLGYRSVNGGQVKYLATLGETIVGAVSFCSGAYKLGPRDLFLALDEMTREEQLPHILNNNLFLILPWIKVRNLASHILALSLKAVRVDWLKKYDVEPHIVETFVDPARYPGTCYKDANWTYLGTTKGYGREGNSLVSHGRLKDIYVTDLNGRFEKISRPDTDRLPSQRKGIPSLPNPPAYFKGILDRCGVNGLNASVLRAELAEHLARYVPFLGREGNYKSFVTMVTGLLNPSADRKNTENIAIAYRGRK